MSFNKTEVRANLRKILNNLYVLSEEGETELKNFSNFTQSVEQLWLISAELYSRDKDGKYKPLDAEKYEKLLKAYGDVLRQAENVLKSNAEDYRLDALTNLTDELATMINDDMESLKNIVPGNDITLPEVIEKGRSVTLDLGDAKLAGSGNALSNRIPIEYELPDGTIRKGFFTEKTLVPVKDDIVDALKPLRTQYPEYAEFLDKFEALDETQMCCDVSYVELSDTLALKEFDKNNVNKVYAFEKHVFDANFNVLNLSEDDQAKIYTRPDFFKFIDDFAKTVGPLASANMLYTQKKTWLGGKSGERIDNRNSAMSMMSKLLGQPKLVAPAEPMTIIAGGRKIEGTFMENAYGKEVFGLSPDDPMLAYDIENYDNPAVFSQIADAQVIDYICGNLDRHEGNFFMQFDGEGKDAKLSGITLIDNDLSFGIDLTYSRVGNIFVVPDNMGIIDGDTAVKVMGLTREVLNLTLKGYGLSDEQIDNAWQRTQTLQDRISKSIEAYKDVPEGTLIKYTPRIVSKDNMDKYSLKTISYEGRSKNQFRVFAALKKKIKENIAYVESKKANKEKAKDIFGLKDEAPKPKAVRLRGKLVEDGFYRQPDIEFGQFKAQAPVDVEIPEDAELMATSGALSSRKALSFTDENGKIQKGFFSSNTILDATEEKARIFRNAEMLYPNFKEFLQSAGNFVIKNNLPLKNIYKTYLPGYSLYDLTVLKEDQSFKKMFDDLSDSLDKVDDMVRHYEILHAEKGSSREYRNIGMTRIAELMGTPDILAKSSFMRIKQGNDIVEGVFMDFAEGKDLSNITADDPMVNYTEDVYNFGPGLKSLSDLQVLDYICMNVDRHMMNLTFRFEEIEGQTKFVGVQGFDNDLSFFTSRYKAGQGTGQLGALEDIKYISEKQADFILNYDSARIEDVLFGCGLKPKEIAAAVDRTQRLKERIENNKIQVLKDDDWDSKTLSELCSGENIFARMKDKVIGNKIKYTALSNSEQKAKKKPLEFVNGKKTEFTEDIIKDLQDKAKAREQEIIDARNNGEKTVAEKIIIDRAESLNAVLKEREEAAKVTNPFGDDKQPALNTKLAGLEASYKKSDRTFGGSKEYKNLVIAFKSVKNAMKNAKNIKNAGITKKLEMLEQIKEDLQYACIAADQMLGKAAGSTSTNQQDRAAFATALKNFSLETQADLSKYNKALLVRQEDIMKQRGEDKAAGLTKYLKDNYNDNYDLPDESQLVNYKINVDLFKITKDITNNSHIEPEMLNDLFAGLLAKEYVQKLKSERAKNDKSPEPSEKAYYEMYKKTESLSKFSEMMAKDPDLITESIVNHTLKEEFTSFIAKEKAKAELEENRIQKAPEKQEDAEEKEWVLIE